MTLLIGSNKTNLMIGGNVTDPNFRRIRNLWQNEREWMIETEQTNKNMLKIWIESIEELIGGKAHYVTVIDKNSSHKRIVIDYDHSSNL